MRWRRPHSRRSGGATTEQAWTAEDVDLVRRAVERAPSVLTPRPWTLEVRDRSAELHRHADQEQRGQDPEGRDRDLSCGAALTNLVLAIRYTGWAVEIRQSPEPADQAPGPDALAVVTCTHRQAPSSAEGQRFRAIPRQHSYRRPFHPQPLTHLARDALQTASREPAVHPRWMSQAQAPAFAALIVRAARFHRRDHHFHREVSMWTMSRQAPDEGPWAGADPEDPGAAEVPAGTNPSMPRLPDPDTLAAWVAEESLLSLSTSSDTHEDRVHAGAAMQQAWLAATSLGLVASAVTRPLHLERFRSALRDELGLPGYPQVLLRFGHPTVVPGQRRG